MSVKDLFYDIETLFIEGKTATEIARELGVPKAEVEDVLDSFGVDAEDMEVDAEDWDELEAFDADDYYGA